MEQHLQDLTEIRSLMERSSRFISLSGLSGVFAGMFALVGAYVAYDRILQDNPSEYLNLLDNLPLLRFIVIDGILVLTFSLIFAFFFTARHAKKKGLKLWDNTSRRLLVNMAVPLVAGGFYCLILLQHVPHLIDSATLVFYGLALINASKYTYDDVKYLGYIEVVLGLACGLMDEWRIGLLFWALGFGVLHIAYGVMMYNKYER
jgi:heme/copper-type cytochrome/quinol oxidase subunit 3